MVAGIQRTIPQVSKKITIPQIEEWAGAGPPSQRCAVDDLFFGHFAFHSALVPCSKNDTAEVAVDVACLIRTVSRLRISFYCLTWNGGSEYRDTY